MNDSTLYFKEYFDQQQTGTTSVLNDHRQQAFAAFSQLGVPGVKHEEWKYTRINSLFNTQYRLQPAETLQAADLNNLRLPAHEAANELVFVNGRYVAALSTLRSKNLVLLPLNEAAEGEYASIVDQHYGHSADYLRDGINALNTALSDGGIYLHIGRNTDIEHPVYIYHIVDARAEAVLAQPRSLVYLGQNAGVTIVETYHTIGNAESFTNQVFEVAVEKDARLEYYKIQNDVASANLVSTSHIRQTGASHVNTVTISLNGGIVRNNLNLVLEAPYCEGHLYGLYFQQGNSHVDNHTIVDNVAPNCLSYELYKGILDEQSTGVFNGKIFVRQPAQKTNAYQTNKNVLLSKTASVNTKPQLEIFADDVKCSHGCTVGQLDEEALFYLRSRGITQQAAQALLLQGFALDVLEKIKLAPIRAYVDSLIAGRLQFTQS